MKSKKLKLSILLFVSLHLNIKVLHDNWQGINEAEN